MLKPKMLKLKDKIAIVSLSSGMLGDPNFIHKYYIAKERLEKEFGLEVVVMKNAMKGFEYIYNHPEKRAEDLMEAFKDESIKAIICAIGGDDTIRILPYIDLEVIKNNPKIFMGYSDTTVNHLMMQKAGVVSFYGPAIISEFGEYVNMFSYTKEAIKNILFADSKDLEIKSSEYISNDFVAWDEKNINIEKKLEKEKYGYEIINGKGIARGKLWGGCVESLQMCIGTELWPESSNFFTDKILLLETSEEEMLPEHLVYFLRNLAAQGILQKVQGIIFGKPFHETYYFEYKEAIKKVIKEYKLEDLKVMYNVNIGHSTPIGVLPLGTDVEVDLDNKKIILKESPVNS